MEDTAVMKQTISLGQMDVKLGDPEANWRTVQTMTAEAARRGSDLVVFPELWSTGYDLENAEKYATPTGEGMFSQLADLAKAHQIGILGSCLSLVGEGQFGNTAVYFDKNGRSLGEYSKLHLFRLMQEEQFLTAGSHTTFIETAWGKAGLTICYDLRFPELFRQYALAGAQLVFVPAEWPHPRLNHWRTLLRARAIENQMFIVACNRVGSSKGTDFFGHSCILDPWGEIVLELGEGEMLGTAEIDIAQVDAVRAKIPVFADRRDDVY
ncbi:MAG: hydrolase MtnU [Ardenticatenaceae bacterium]|nr:MAG: hydrolase MtnU [Ardenticatenaceae bacterium]